MDLWLSSYRCLRFVGSGYTGKIGKTRRERFSLKVLQSVCFYLLRGAVNESNNIAYLTYRHVSAYGDVFVTFCDVMRLWVQ